MENRTIKLTIYVTPSEYSVLQIIMRELKYPKHGEYFRDVIKENKKPTKSELAKTEQRIKIIEGLSALNTQYQNTIQLLENDDDSQAFKERVEAIITKNELLINKYIK